MSKTSIELLYNMSFLIVLRSSFDMDKSLFQYKYIFFDMNLLESTILRLRTYYLIPIPLRWSHDFCYSSSTLEVFTIFQDV